MNVMARVRRECPRKGDTDLIGDAVPKGRTKKPYAWLLKLSFLLFQCFLVSPSTWQVFPSVGSIEF